MGSTWPVPAGKFKKRQAMSCRCRKHPVGSPKVGGSPCHGGAYHPATVERIVGKRLARDWLRFGETEER